MHSPLPLLLPLLSLTFPLLTTSHPTPPPYSDLQKILYILDNSPTGASIIAAPLPQHPNEHKFNVSVNGVKTSTGGLGAVGLTAPVGPGTAGPDSLYGQHAVVVGGDFIFTVNPGSNTLVMFRIDPHDPLNPSLVGEPMDTMGDWPMSVAYSEELRMACVLNGGSTGSVSCFSVSPHAGLTPLDKSPRPIFPSLNQTNPASGPANTASDLVFSPSSNFLIASVKGNAGSTPPVHGALTAWAVEGGKVATTPVVSSFGDMFMQFGIAFAGSDEKLLVSDVSYGGSLLDVNTGDLTMIETAHFALPELLASCWAVYAPALDTGYLVDAGKPEVAVVDIATGTVEGVLVVDAGLGGLFDSVVQGKLLYALAGTAEVAVIKLVKGKKMGELVQRVQLGSLGDRTDWQGLAIWPGEEHGHGHGW